MKLNPFKRSDPRQSLANVATEARCLHTSTIALRDFVEEKEAVLVLQVQNTLPISGNIGHIRNAMGAMVVLSQSAGVELAGAKALLATLEDSNEFKQAAAIIEPLLEEIAELEADEQTKREEKYRRAAALQEVEQAAKARALAAAAADPEVIAAKRKLEEAEAAASETSLPQQ